MEVPPVHMEGGHSSTGASGAGAPVAGLWGQGDVYPVWMPGGVAVAETDAA